MSTLSLQIPEEFNMELSASLRTLYRQAIDQARKDATMMRDFLTFMISLKVRKSLIIVAS